MVPLKISDATARKLYPSAANELKEILEASFPENFFNQKITDRIKTFEDALNEVGAGDNIALSKLTEKSLPTISGVFTKGKCRQKDFVIIKAFYEERKKLFV